MLSCVVGFINRNRTKLIITTVVLTAITTVYYIYNTSNQIEEDNHIDQDDRDKYKNERYQHSIQLLSSSQQSKLCNRSRVIWKIRKQYDNAIHKLLITFKLKIIELIDIQNTVRNIKELRLKYKNTQVSSNLKNYEELEDQLWNEIKISTFTFLFIISYILPAICILLKIQLYILARSLLSQLNDLDDISHIALLDSDMFRLFVEGTFQHIYGKGLISFISNVKQIVAKHLLPWEVKQKIQVQPGELIEIMQLIRNDIESEHNIIQTIFVPILDESAADVDSHSNKLLPVQSLLNQTWDIFESPEFYEVYKESVDTTYRIISAEIQHHIFSIPPVDYYSHILSGSNTTTPTHTNFNNHHHHYSSSGSKSSVNVVHHLVQNDHQHQQLTTPPSTPLSSTNNTTPVSVFEPAPLHLSSPPSQQSQYGSMKAPPLASVLPQMKSIALKLLPTNTNNFASTLTTTAINNDSSSGSNINGSINTDTTSDNSSSCSIGSNTTTNNNIHSWVDSSSIALISNEIKEISSGPYLESFCIAILDANITN